MKPILYDKLKTNFTFDYIGILTDVIECTVTEGRNDQYELEMKYPAGGMFGSSLELDAVIKAKPNNMDEPQPFRIYRIVKESNQVLTINARHIVYDLSKVTVSPFTSTGTIVDAISGIISHSNPSCGFTFDTDKTTSGNYKVSVPTSFRALMGGTQGSLLDVYGTAEYHYDGYDIELLSSRGQNSGVTIKYGKNLMDMKQEEECESVYTAVFPFWRGTDDYLQLDERIISVPGEYPFSRIMILNLSSEFQDKPTQQQLRNKTNQYINEYQIGVPKVNLEVDFTGTDEEQNINLCDIITVDFEKIGISASAKCIELTYDVITERVINVKLGYYKHTFTDSVLQQVKGRTETSILDPTQIESAISKIINSTEGYVIFHKSTNQSKADEVLILTGTDKLNLVSKLWRWNSGGLGYSSNGYGGPYDLAITSDGHILAGMIKTGTMRAITITNGNGFSVDIYGRMTAVDAYIGATGTGFTITTDTIYNSRIRLQSNGVVMKSPTANTDIMHVGKTEYVHGQSGDYWWWEVRPEIIVNDPGIGMLGMNSIDKIGWYWYDQTISANRSIFSYQHDIYGSSSDPRLNPQSPEYDPSVPSTTVRWQAINLWKILDMHSKSIRNAQFMGDPIYDNYMEPYYYKPSGNNLLCYSWALDGYPTKHNTGGMTTIRGYYSPDTIEDIFV